jgi:DNA-binding transcriptional regulator PaaX
VAYRQEIERIQAVLAGPEPDGATALVTHPRALARVRRVSNGDPILPDALRPPGWPGVELREAWMEFCALLAGPARRYVADVLARPTQRRTADLPG